MKASQKLVVEIEQIKMTVRFDQLDAKLLPVAAMLEKKGDLFGPVAEVIFAPNDMCVCMRYADKRRGPVNPTIFSRDWETIQAMQQGAY